MKKFREDSWNFKYTNLNPKNRKRAGDCVVRAIAYATEKSWEEVFKGLAQLSLELKEVPSMRKVYGKYLEDMGFVMHKQPRKKDNTKFKLHEWANWNKDLQIVRLKGHLTVIDRGIIRDTGNCSHSTVGNYWTLK